jgi:hypothetical protein
VSKIVSDYLLLRVHCESVSVSKNVKDYLVLRIHCEQGCEWLFSFENILQVVIKYFTFALSLGMKV